MFRKEKYHHVRLTLGGAEAVSEKIAAPEESGGPAGGLCRCGGGLRFRTREQKKEAPPRLYDLTTLQREGQPPVRLHGQADAGLTLNRCTRRTAVTYPRTTAGI